MQFSRQKGDYVAKKMYDRKSYQFVEQLMADVVKVARRNLDVASLPERPHLPISRQEPPQKTDIVERLRSRMGKE